CQDCPHLRILGRSLTALASRSSPTSSLKIVHTSGYLDDHLQLSLPNLPRLHRSYWISQDLCLQTLIQTRIETHII
ncbi:hypothetical protein TorRG33x02_324090, partial [Trema orientale]